MQVRLLPPPFLLCFQSIIQLALQQLVLHINVTDAEGQFQSTRQRGRDIKRGALEAINSRKG